jgi:hypothetical protein
MSAFPNIIDVGLTGGYPKFSTDEIRRTWGITAPPEKTILLTFGGLGLQAIPYNNVNKFSDWQFITFDASAPDLSNLIKVTNRQYRPVDFMSVCSRVVSKPGYSTFAEATLLGLPIITIPRHDFAEAALLLDGIQNYNHHQIITPADLFDGQWDFLHDLPQPPKKPQPIAKNGNETIAQAVIDYFQSM